MRNKSLDFLVNDIIIKRIFNYFPGPQEMSLLNQYLP